MADEEKKANDNTIEITLPELTRDLEKMTVKELREIGLMVPTLVGVHGMKKDELVAALKEVYGIVDEPTTTGIQEVAAIKQKIRALKRAKAEAREAGDKAKVEINRRRINRLKKQTRKLAKAARAAA